MSRPLLRAHRRGLDLSSWSSSRWSSVVGSPPLEEDVPVSPLELELVDSSGSAGWPRQLGGGLRRRRDDGQATCSSRLRPHAYRRPRGGWRRRSVPCGSPTPRPAAPRSDDGRVATRWRGGSGRRGVL